MQNGSQVRRVHPRKTTEAPKESLRPVRTSVTAIVLDCGAWSTAQIRQGSMASLKGITLRSTCDPDAEV